MPSAPPAAASPLTAPRLMGTAGKAAKGEDCGSMNWKLLYDYQKEENHEQNRLRNPLD